MIDPYEREGAHFFSPNSITVGWEFLDQTAERVEWGSVGFFKQRAGC